MMIGSCSNVPDCCRRLKWHTHNCLLQLDYQKAVAILHEPQSGDELVLNVNVIINVSDSFTECLITHLQVKTGELWELGFHRPARPLK